MTTEERNAKCGPISQEVLKMIADYKVTNMFGTDLKEMAAEYADLQNGILKVYLDNELTASEISYIRSLVIALVDMPLNFVKESVSDSYDRTIEKMFGKPESEITVKDMDKLLQK